MTEKLYWEYPYAHTFVAEIVDIRENGLVLDRTLFHPESGGQSCDLGMLKVNEMELDVTRVSREDDGSILHHVTGVHGCLEVQDEVKGLINWDRRYLLMKAHTAQHVFSSIMLEEHDRNTTSVSITPGGFTARVNKHVDGSMIEQIIESVNHVLFTQHPVKNVVLSREEAIKKYGDIIRGLMSDEDPVRVIQVEDIEVTCCGGTHVKDTSEIGPIYLEGVKKGVKFTFLVGDDAISALARANTTVFELANHVNQDHARVLDTITGRLDKHEQLQDDLITVAQELLGMLATRPQRAINGFGVSILEIPLEKKVIAPAFSKFPWNSILVVLGDGGRFIVFSSAEDMPASGICNAFLETHGGKGGGNQKVSQGKMEQEPSPRVLFDTIESLLENA
ncbi:hypothetical protein GF325_04420 [Candidatus Bathyarchaeota archaeon]|nr:hypothetical protein [Candidatus Bathyarchaeota archaeon]